MISVRPDRKILLLETDASIRRILQAFLALHGYQVFQATSAAEGLRTFFATQPELILLDSLLPGVQDQEFCQRFHRCADIPILVWCKRISDSRYQQLQQQIANQEKLADAASPMRHLLTMFPELQPCSHTLTTKAEDKGQFHLRLDTTQYQVIHPQGKSKLTIIEYRLLQFLMQNQGAVLSVNQILEGVWGKNNLQFTPYVHNYVWRLRQKIENDPHHPQHIISEYGAGYRFINE